MIQTRPANQRLSRHEKADRISWHRQAGCSVGPRVLASPQHPATPGQKQDAGGTVWPQKEPLGFPLRTQLSSPFSWPRSLLHLPPFVWLIRATPILLMSVQKVPHATSMGWHREAPAHTESVGHAEEGGGSGEGCFSRAILGSFLAKATKQEVPHAKEHHEGWAKEAWKGGLKEGRG